MSGAEFVSMFCSHMKCKPSNCFHLSGMNQKEPIMHPDDEDMNNDYAAGGCICWSRWDNHPASDRSDNRFHAFTGEFLLTCC